MVRGALHDAFWFFVQIIQEVIHQKWDVELALPQGRQHDRITLKPVKKVFPEIAFLDSSSRSRWGRGMMRASTLMVLAADRSNSPLRARAGTFT